MKYGGDAMLYIIITFLAILFIWFFSKGYQNKNSVAVNHIHIKKDSPSSEVPLNVLQISDMHLENISITPQNLYETLKTENIDLIALTGDFLDRKRTIPKLIPYLEVFMQLKPTFGCYAVFGNHDYVLKTKHLQRLEEVLEKHDVKILRNEHVAIPTGGTQLNIIGIDDYGTNHSDLNKAYKNLGHGYRLVLTHDPNIVLEMKKYPFDYLLSGHFHGGQICWPKPYQLTKLGRMGKLPQMNILKGLHHVDDKPFYISEGLGQTGVNIRMGSRPEITLHHLEASTLLSTKEWVSNKGAS